MKHIIRLMGIACLLAVTACAPTEEIMEQSPETLYRKGYDAFQSKDYEKAATYFDEVEKQHPYSIWAERSQIMAAYAFYQQNEYDDAVLVLDRFIQLHPGNRNTPYAYYLKGLCYYEQISDAAREQSMTEKAQQTFNELIARYPNSIYVADARAKQGLILNHLAAQNMVVGRYYLKQGDLIPALNRFRTVVVDYPNTNQVPEAYYRLGTAYVLLGMDRAANDMVNILKKRWPDNEWTKRSQKIISAK